MNRTISFKRVFLLFSAIILANVGWGQSVPDWYNEDSRRAHYPDNIYYTGIAYGEITSSSTEGKTIQNAEQSAKTEALSKILMSVKSQTLSYTFSSANGVDEEYLEQFSSRTQIDVVFKDVPGMQCQHFKKGKTVIAFAYVKKIELARYYDRKITSLLTKIETVLDNADELVRHGEKIKARTTSQTAVQYVAELENAQRILLAVSNNADIQSGESSKLTKRLVSLLAELKNSTAIYLDCKAYSQDKPYRLFSNDLKGVLSKLGCNFVNSREDADWIISIEADISRQNEVSGAYFVWIDGAVAVRNNATSKVVYNEQISSISGTSDGIKGAHTAGYAQASANAYKEVAKVVGDKISEIIKQ